MARREGVLKLAQQIARKGRVPLRARDAMELFGPCRAIILFLATTHGGAMLAILAVAAAATLAHLRRQRRRQIHSKHTIDELHGATSEDVVSAFRNGVPLKLGAHAHAHACARARECVNMHVRVPNRR